MVEHFLGLLPLAGLVLEQREAAHTVLRALPTICWLTWDLGLVHSEKSTEQMPKCLLWPGIHWGGRGRGNKKNKSQQHQNNHVLQKSLTRNKGLNCTFPHWVQMENDWDHVWICLWWRWEMKEVLLS